MHDYKQHRYHVSFANNYGARSLRWISDTHNHIALVHFNAPSAYKNTISMNVSDMVANVIKQCVWILQKCLQMHSCIPLNPHTPEQI